VFFISEGRQKILLGRDERRSLFFPQHRGGAVKVSFCYVKKKPPSKKRWCVDIFSPNRKTPRLFLTESFRTPFLGGTKTRVFYNPQYLFPKEAGLFFGENPLKNFPSGVREPRN